MRVLQVMPGLGGGGGAERSTVDVAHALSEGGVVLHLALLTDRRGLVGEIEAAGATVWDLSDARGALRRARALRRLIDVIRPDVVHATLFDASLAAQLAWIGARWRSPRDASPALLVTWASTSYDDGHVDELALTHGRRLARAKLAAVVALETVLARCTRAHFHAVTEGVAEMNAAKLRVPAERVHVAERGRDATRFEPPADGEEGRDRHPLPPDVVSAGVPHDARVVMAIGRQELEKGHDRLLDQFDRLAARDPSVWLLIAGREGEATAALARQRGALRHGDRVRFLGHRDDVADLLRAADVVVCASRREGAAGALIEAMACGRPVVSVALPGLVGVLTDGHDALVVDADRLWEGISAILRDPERARRMGRAARQTFEDRFRSERAAAAMAAVYEMLAGSERGRSNA